MQISQTTQEVLLNTGFVETQYIGQDGTFFVKDVYAVNLPCLLSIYNDELASDTVVTVCVCPNGDVQFVIPAIETADTYSADSEAGNELLEQTIDADGVKG